MKFSVLAVAHIPDTQAAKNTHNTEGLNEEAIGKMLFHARKQQTGASEELRWDQEAIAAITILHYNRTGMHIESMSRSSHTEEEMLENTFGHIAKGNPIVSWNGNHGLLASLQFRAMMTNVTLPTNWDAILEGGESHIDLTDWLNAGALSEAISLDDMAKKLGYPGMIGYQKQDLWDRYLNDSMRVVGEFADLEAINTLLVALRVFSASGDLRTGTANANAMSLYEILSTQSQNHLGRYARAWNIE